MTWPTPIHPFAGSERPSAAAAWLGRPSSRIVAAAGIVALGTLLGSGVRAEILKCVNDAGRLLFVNTGACPEGYKLSEATPESSAPRPPAATDSGEKVPTIWELGFGDREAEEWLQKKLTDKSRWTAEGLASTPEKVWDQMKAALLRGDTGGALSCFSPFTKDKYREVFRALGPNTHVAVQEMKELILREKNDFAAVYWLRRDDQIGGRMQPVVFPVTFIRGGNGVWLIDRF